MNFKEVQRLLKMMNVDMNEDHALRLFQVSTTALVGRMGRGGLHNASLLSSHPCAFHRQR